MTYGDITLIFSSKIGIMAHIVLALVVMDATAIEGTLLGDGRGRPPGIKRLIKPAVSCTLS
jgi:hypothetical protein